MNTTLPETIVSDCPLDLTTAVRDLTALRAMLRSAAGDPTVAEAWAVDARLSETDRALLLAYSAKWLAAARAAGAPTDAVRDVLAELVRVRADSRGEGALGGEMVDVVGSLLAPASVTGLPKLEDHPRSRLVLCAAFLLAEIERVDRATDAPAPPEGPGGR